MAHPKHNEVRERYGRCCGYCGVDEEATGGELTIDHFRPTVAGGDDSDENLVYCCFRCNLYKGDFEPSEADRTAGRRVLHPLLDAAINHLRLNERTGRLEALTRTGQFHITLLHLNRPALVDHRVRKRHIELMRARNELLDAETRELRAIVTAQEKYIKHLRQLLEDEARGQ